MQPGRDFWMSLVQPAQSRVSCAVRPLSAPWGNLLLGTVATGSCSDCCLPAPPGPFQQSCSPAGSTLVCIGLPSPAFP